MAGRKHGGGIKIGEMETHSMVSHGSSSLLIERLCLSADAYKTIFCTTCGTIVTHFDPEKNSICKICGDLAEFGTCTIPYGFKYLIHLLTGMGYNLTLGMKRKA